MIDIGKTLSTARKRKGWSQSHLAKQIDMSVDWVRKVEYGRSKRPHYDALLRAANVLGLSPAELIPGHNHDSLGELEYIPQEQVDSINNSIRQLRQLSPEGVKTAEKLLEALVLLESLAIEGTQDIPDV